MWSVVDKTGNLKMNGIGDPVTILHGGTGKTTAGDAQAALNDEFTTTATGNIDDLDFSNASLIRMNNASDATIRGLKAGTPGQRVTIASVGAGNVFLAYQNGGSSPSNQLINTITSVDTPLAHMEGYAGYQYDAVTGRWRMIAHMQGGAFAYTPVWTASISNPSLGNGTLTGSYEIISGRRVSTTLTLTIGSTTTLGSGHWFFTIFVPLTGVSLLGNAFGQINATGANYTAMSTFTDSTRFVVLSTSTTNLFDSTHPFAWTTGDTLNVSATYLGT